MWKYFIFQISVYNAIFSKNKLVANISAQECFFFLKKKRFSETMQVIKKKAWHIGFLIVYDISNIAMCTDKNQTQNVHVHHFHLVLKILGGKKSYTSTKDENISP